MHETKLAVGNLRFSRGGRSFVHIQSALVLQVELASRIKQSL